MASTVALNINVTDAFEKESIEADNLYQTARSLKDISSSNSLANTVNSQTKELQNEKASIQAKINELKKKTHAHERDFLDQREEKGEIVPASLFPHSLQDSALSFFIISWILFGMILIGFGFMPPLGNFNSGMGMIVGYILASFCVYGLIHSFA